MGRPSTARIARARAFSSWFGGFCTHLDGDELILLLEEHHEGRPRPEPCPVRVEFAPKRHENVIEPSLERFWSRAPTRTERDRATTRTSRERLELPAPLTVTLQLSTTVDYHQSRTLEGSLKLYFSMTA